MGLRLKTTLMIATALNILACSKGGGSSGSSSGTTSAAASTITIGQSPAYISPGGTMTLTPTGGTPPYTFTLASSGIGTLSTTTGTSSIFTADAAGDTASVLVTDAANNFATVVIAPVGGTGTTGTTTTTTTTAVCQGSFNLTISNTGGGTLSMVTDSSGNMYGEITIQGGVAPIHGTCSSGAISFYNDQSGSTYTGTYFYNAANTSQLVFSGTFVSGVNGSTYNWMATR